MKQPQEDILPSSKLTPKQLEARKLRMEVANNWIKKLREFEQKNYPAPVARIMAKTTNAAIKWTEAFTREDAGAMQITLGNIAGKDGEEFVQKYNKIEQDAVTKSRAAAVLVQAKNEFVVEEGVGMVRDGRKIKDELKAIPGEVRQGVEKVADTVEKVVVAVSPELLARKEEAKAAAQDATKEVIQIGKELTQADKEKKEAEAEAKRKEAEAEAERKKTEKAKQDAQSADDKVTTAINGATGEASSHSSPNTTSKGLNKEVTEGEQNPLQILDKDLASKVKLLQDLNPEARLTGLKSIRDQELQSTIDNPNEKQKDMILQFITENKTLLGTLILDEEFQKKLASGSNNAMEYLAFPNFKELFLGKKGKEFYAFMPKEKQDDLRVIDEFIRIAQEAEYKKSKLEHKSERLEELEKDREVAERRLREAERKYATTLESYMSSAEQAKAAQSRLYQAEQEVRVATGRTRVVENSGADNRMRTISSERMIAYQEQKKIETGRLTQETGKVVNVDIRRNKGGKNGERTYSLIVKDPLEKLPRDQLVRVPEVPQPHWRRFGSRSEVKEAKNYYVLFSQEPFNVFLHDTLPALKNKHIQLKSVWNKINPGKEMEIQDFKDLLMVAMLKKMKPDTYGGMSYRSIMEKSGITLADEFTRYYADPANRGKLEFKHDGYMQDIATMMDITKELPV